MRSSRKANNDATNKKNKGVKILVVTLVAIILISAIILAIKLSSKKKEEPQAVEEDVETVVLSNQKIKIVDVNSKTRPYAVMINNNHEAWPQCGLSDAYLVYEIITEGGITRMMALYKDKYPEKVGSVRSARHYFLDYAEENDAIFVHWGGSPQAYSRIYAGINDIDGIALEGSVFFRDRTLRRSSEHTGFADMVKVKEYAQNQGYTRDTTKGLLLNYSATSVNLSEKENAKEANNVEIKYSYYHTTSYEYDAENKVYKRFMSEKANIDLETEEQYTAKNIIVYKVRNYTLNDGENKGRQELENIGSGSGYYISEGYSVPITWEKSSHSSQTIYKFAEGEELTVNDGNTFIQICPTDADITVR